MTRPTKHEISQDLDELKEQSAEHGGGLFILLDGAPEEYCVTINPPKEDPIDEHTEPAVPQHIPSEYFEGGIAILESDDITELWDSMPDEVREREREYRETNDEPIPPILDETH